MLIGITESEIDNFDISFEFIQEQVLRLEVAMHYIQLMDVLDPS